MNQIQVTCDKECIYCNDGFCECDQHLLDVAEEFLRLKIGEEVEHLKERESIGAASMEDCSKYEWDFLHESIWINPWKVLSKEECDPELGRKIIKLFHRENGYVCFELMRNRNNEIEAEDVLLNRALCNADKNASKYPKWTEFPEEVLQWIIENLLGNAIAELDGYPYAIGLKNKNLIESKVVHPESEYDYVNRFDDDEADLLNYNCRYSYSKPDLKESKKESKNISAEQKLMKKDAVKKEPFLITKEMIAVGIHQTIFNYEEQGDGKIKVILYPSNVRFTIGIESLSISSDIRKVEIIFSYLRTQYRSMDAKLFNEIQENIIDQYIQYMAYEGIKKTNTLDFHVRMQECDLLKLYDLFIYHRDRNHLMVNANSCDNDVCCNRYASKYANAIGEEININEFNDVLIGNCYERDPERFSKLYDGMFKHFLESFNFEANGIYRIHDFTCADGVLIGRKMEFVFE